jgi:hypothetical protein
MRTDDFVADYEQQLRTAANRLAARRRRRGMRTWRGSRRTTGLLVASLASATLVIVALVTTLGAEQQQRIPANERPVVAVPHDEVTTPGPTSSAPTFQILKADGSTAIPKAELGDLLEDPVIRRLGVEWDQATLARSDAGRQVYVARDAANNVCLVKADTSGTTFGCGPVTDAAYTVIHTRTGKDDDHTLVVGLIPDGVKRVTVRERSQTTEAPVLNNVFVAEIGHEAATVQWADGAGSHESALNPSALQPPVNGDGR